MIGVVACDSSDDASPSDTSKDYLPLRTGWYQLYDVSEITYTLGEPETLAYELKTVVADSFQNQSGEYTYVIHRSRRSDGGSWENAGTWSVRINNREAVVNEENIPFVVLRFPVHEGSNWNGNEYNTVVNPGSGETEDEYLVEEAGVSYPVGESEFEDCVVVNQEDNQEFIVYFDQRKEVYARHIGLVYKEKTQLHYCTDTDKGCIGQQIVEEGIIYKQSIKAYGME
jgi:hypothetical protein